MGTGGWTGEEHPHLPHVLEIWTLREQVVE